MQQSNLKNAYRLLLYQFFFSFQVMIAFGGG